MRLQCEQAYQKGISLDVIRFMVDNIHSERLAVLSTNDGTPVLGYCNHSFVGGNCTFTNATLDCLTSGTAPDGSPLAATSVKVRFNSARSTFTDYSVSGTVYQTTGSYMTLDDLYAENLRITAPASSTMVTNSQIAQACYVEPKSTFVRCVLNDFHLTTNGFFVTVQDSDINEVIFDVVNGTLGDIAFTNCIIQEINYIDPPTAGYKATTFNDCNINVCNGAFNAVAIFNNGVIGTAALASQTKFQFNNVEFGTFNYSGNSGFLTNGCRAGTVTAWTYPLSVNYLAGTITERIGYNAAGKIYQNTDGALTWVKIA